MGELGALFNPGMRHEIAERKAKAARREEEGSADPGDLRIDLLSGVAVIALGRNGGRPDTSSGTGDRTDGMNADDRDDQADRDPQDEQQLAEQGSAPERHERNVGVDAGDAEQDVDQDALEIARGSSNDEPPA